MAGYKEPLAVMTKTLDTLKAQNLRSYRVRRTYTGLRHESWKAKRTLCRFLPSNHLHKTSLRCGGGNPRFIFEMQFENSLFAWIEIFVGKCSNANYATRQAVEIMKKENRYFPESITFTTCDTDNLFAVDYLQRLGREFQKRKDRHEVIWQPPLFYNYDLDERPFFVRVTGNRILE